MSNGIISKRDVEAFEKNYRDAKGFHHRAEQFLEEGQCASVVFNVASIALECYLIALCNLHSIYPTNHNYGCLMDAAEIIVDFPLELNKEIRSLDVMFNICSLEDYHCETPCLSDSNRAISMCNEVLNLINEIKFNG